MINQTYKGAILFICSILAILVFTGCPEPMVKPMLDVARDEIPPEIIITSPDRDSYYRSEILVQGQMIDHIYDAGDGLGSLQKQSCTWEVLNHTGFKDTVQFDEDGLFSFSINSSTFTGPIIIRLYGEDSKGNSSQKEISLYNYSSGPEITIISPENDSIYGIRETVSGVITNNPGAVQTNEVNFDSLLIEVGTLISSADAEEEDFSINPATGEFSFSFDTHSLNRPETITISVKDKNGNLSTSRIRIQNSVQGPVIEFREPANYSIYNESVTVQGSIVNPDENGVDFVNPDSVFWSIQDNRGHFYRSDQTERPQGFSFAYDPDNSGDGDFVLTYRTAGMGGRHTIVIQAETHHQQAASQVLYLENDTDGPYVEILSPQYGSEYQSSVTFAGEIRNAFDDVDLNLVDHLSWKIPATPSLFGEDVPFKNHPGEGEAGYNALLTRDGQFSFVIDFPFDTKDRQSVQITATDIHGDTETVHWVLNDDRLGPAVTVYRDSAYTQLFGSVSMDEEFGTGNNMKTVYISILNSEGMPETGHEIIRAEYEVVNDSEKNIAGSLTAVNESSGRYELSFSTSGIKDNSIILRITAEHEDSHVTVHDIPFEKNGTVPKINITSPVDGDYYYETVTLEGSVMNSEEDSNTDNIDSLFWCIPGTVENEWQEIANFTLFSEIIETVSMTGAKIISIKATDTNGNTATRSIPIFDDTSSPEITNLSPENYEKYGWSTTISGTVLPVTGRLENIDKDSIRYSLDKGNTWYNPVITNHEAESGYDFTFTIDTKTRQDPLNITVSASDLNGDETQVSLTLVNDNEGPDFSIDSPAFGQDVTTMVTLELTCETALEELNELKYKVNGSVDFTYIKHSVDEALTSYSEVIDLSSFSTDVTIEITATDWQKNKTVKTVVLYWQGSHYPSASIGNVENSPGQLNMQWDPLPPGISTSYYIYYTSDGSYPSGAGGVPTAGSSTTCIEVLKNDDPVPVADLQNGTEHIFMLEDSATGSKSDYLKAVSMSDLTLFPKAESYNDGVRLEWYDFPAFDNYIVERSTAKDGTYSIIGLTETNSFFDYSSEDQDFYYRVYAQNYPAVKSRPVVSGKSRFKQHSTVISQEVLYSHGNRLSHMTVDSENRLVYGVDSGTTKRLVVYYSHPDGTFEELFEVPGLFSSIGTELHHFEVTGNGHTRRYLSGFYNSTTELVLIDVTDVLSGLPSPDASAVRAVTITAGPAYGSPQIMVPFCYNDGTAILFVGDASSTGRGVIETIISLNASGDPIFIEEPVNIGYLRQRTIVDLIPFQYGNSNMLGVLKQDTASDPDLGTVYQSHFDLYTIVAGDQSFFEFTTLLKQDTDPVEEIEYLSPNHIAAIDNKGIKLYRMGGEPLDLHQEDPVTDGMESFITIDTAYDQMNDILYLYSKNGEFLAYKHYPEATPGLVLLKKWYQERSLYSKTVSLLDDNLLIPMATQFHITDALPVPQFGFEEIPFAERLENISISNNYLLAKGDTKKGSFHYENGWNVLEDASSNSSDLFFQEGDFHFTYSLSTSLLRITDYGDQINIKSHLSHQFNSPEYLGDQVTDLAASGQYLAVTFKSGKIAIFDYSKQHDLKLIKVIYWNIESPESVTLAGNDLYVATKNYLGYYDLNSKETGINKSIAVGFEADHIVIHNDLILLSCGQNDVGSGLSGFRILDRHTLDPVSALVTHSDISTPVSPVGELMVLDDYVFTGYNTNELSLIDISNPFEPVIFNTYDLPGRVDSLAYNRYGIATGSTAESVIRFGHFLQ